MTKDEDFEGAKSPRSLGPLAPGSWLIDTSSGMISLTEEALNQIVNKDPIDKWYSLDPKPIARGQFAVVYLCHHRGTGKEYAAKISSRWRHGTDSTASIIHEIAVSAMLPDNDKAVQLVDVFSSETEIVLIMEYASGGDLQTVLDEKRYPYESDVIGFMRQLLECLVFLHDRNIVHLDIKPPNLVLMGDFPDCEVKLCDFEISRMLTPGKEVREILGTPDYVAPEVIHYEPITTMTDMWSVGVLTYVMLTSYLPFGGESDQETYLEISQCELDFPTQLFEDITPDAIDFISKLLIRQPEQRMSAKESLQHVWIRSGFKRPTPPSTLDLFPCLSQDYNPQECITTVEPFSFENSSNPSSRKSSYDSIDSRSTTASKDIRITIPDLSSPTKDFGRPPLHPSFSQKSIFGDQTPLTGTPATTPGSLLASPFVYRPEPRLGPKHNLERLRSLSKSREVLSEKVLLSNLKKSQSKSREKLCEARLGLSKSRDQLQALKSFSQSIEAISASRLHQQTCGLYQSCNNIFVPKSQHLRPDETQGRMYQSIACIDQIDKLNCMENVGYFEPRVTINDIVTKQNSNLNCFSSGIPSMDYPMRGGGLRINTCKGGRGDACDKKCSRNHRVPEAQQTQRIRKTSKADKMKRDAEKRRREKKEKEKQEKSKRRHNSVDLDLITNKSSEKSVNNNLGSPTFRRGSVSNVEQRLQERHERNQEKLERLEKEERKHRSKRYGSVDLGRVSLGERHKTSKSSISSFQRTRSVTPTRRRRKSKKDLSPVSDASIESFDSSSTETVIESTPAIPIPDVTVTAEDTKLQETYYNNDTDEAYISLEETAPTNLFLMKLNSVDNNATEKKDDEKHEDENLSVSERIQNFEKVLTSMHNHKTASPRHKKGTFLALPLDTDDTSSNHSSELSIITEEESPDFLKVDRSFKRSMSATSDLGSTVSETSEDSHDQGTEKASSDTDSDHTFQEWKTRTRSLSVYAKSSFNSKPYSRSRSNSCQLETNVENIVRPWGNVCSGSFARAFEKFNSKPDDSKAENFQTHNRRQSSPVISPSRETVSLVH